MCTIAGAVSGGLSVARGYAGWQRQQSQYAGQKAAINARNQASRNAYSRAIEQQNTEWNNTLKIWNQRLGQYQKQLERNMDAAYGFGGAYQQLQIKTNEAFNQAAFANQGALTKLYKTLGMGAATGMTGKTADRFDVASLGAFGREQAIRTSNLVRSIEGQRLDQENVRRQLDNANQRAYQSVAVAPVPGRRPAPPTLLGGPIAPSPFGAITEVAGGLFGAAEKGGLLGIGAQDRSLKLNAGSNFDYSGSSSLYGGLNLNQGNQFSLPGLQ